MFMKLTSLFVLAAACFCVSAQSSTSAPSALPSIDACTLSCIESAATSNGCSSYTNLSCVCTSTAFQTSARSCLQANCTSADLQAAEALQSTECAAANSSSSAASSTSTSGSSTSSAPATTSTTTKSGAGLAGVDAHVVMGAAVAMVGMLAGMGLVL